MIVLGVDPGATGALAFLDGDGDLVHIEDMPMLDKRVSGALVADLIDRHRPAHAVIEQVWGTSPMGAASAFSFGNGDGIVRGVLAHARIPVTEITPAKWKKAMGLNRDKDASRKAALNRWPQHSAWFRFKKHDGRAEAALIALWGLERDLATPPRSPAPQPWDATNQPMEATQ